MLALGLPLGLLATSAHAATIRPAAGAGVASPRIGLPPQPACQGDDCGPDLYENQSGLDPSATKCSAYYTTSVPMSITVSGHLLATGRNVYSTGCNANWTEGTLTSYAISLGYKLAAETIAKDSYNPQNEECTSFPGNDSEAIYKYQGALLDCWYTSGYGGSTGWPAYTNMVDGTNITMSFMAVYDSHQNFVASTDAYQ